METAQKIFPTRSSWGTLAFALSGWTLAGHMDWKDQARQIADDLKSEDPKDLCSYAEMFCDRLREWVQREKDRTREYDMRLDQVLPKKGHHARSAVPA